MVVAWSYTHTNTHHERPARDRGHGAGDGLGLLQRLGRLGLLFLRLVGWGEIVGSGGGVMKWSVCRRCDGSGGVAAPKLVKAMTTIRE